MRGPCLVGPADIPARYRFDACRWNHREPADGRYGSPAAARGVPREYDHSSARGVALEVSSCPHRGLPKRIKQKRTTIQCGTSDLTRYSAWVKLRLQNGL